MLQAMESWWNMGYRATSHTGMTTWMNKNRQSHIVASFWKSVNKNVACTQRNRIDGQGHARGPSLSSRPRPEDRTRAMQAAHICTLTLRGPGHTARQHNPKLPRHMPGAAHTSMSTTCEQTFAGVVHEKPRTRIL